MSLKNRPNRKRKKHHEDLFRGVPSGVPGHEFLLQKRHGTPKGTPLLNCNLMKLLTGPFCRQAGFSIIRLSRRKQGFDSPWDYQELQGVSIVDVDTLVYKFYFSLSNNHKIKSQEGPQ
jgi:hypothetical protein